MAAGDYYVDPNGRYVEVHTLSTRERQVASINIRYELGMWPPPDEIIDNFWLDYVMDRADIDGAVEVDTDIWYSDRFFAFESEATTNINIDGDQENHDAGMAWMFFDLSDFPYSLSDVTRVELVTYASVSHGHGGLAESPETPDPLDMILSWENNFSSPYGFPVGPDDWRWSWPGDAFELPLIELDKVQDAADEGENINPYPETELFKDPEIADFWGTDWPEYYAFPLENYESSLHEGLVGLVMNQRGPVPTQQNFVRFEAWDDDIDDYADQSLRFRFFQFPKLRLWFAGGSVRPQANFSMSMGMRATAQLPVNPIYHRRRQRRGH